MQWFNSPPTRHAKALVVVVVERDHRVLANYSYTLLLLLSLLFLAVPAVPPAQYSEVNGAQIWIKVPHLFSIQPGEFAKIALVVFAADLTAPCTCDPAE